MAKRLLPLAHDTHHVYRVSQRVTTGWERSVALANRAYDVSDDEADHVLDGALIW